MCFNPKLGHCTCAIRHIPCVDTQHTSTLDKFWTLGIPAQQQLRYQTIKDFMCFPVLDYFNNWYIIQFSHKSTSSEYILKIYQVVLDNISDNMISLV